MVIQLIKSLTGPFLYVGIQYVSGHVIDKYCIK